MLIDLSNIKREKMVIETPIYRIDSADWEAEYEKDKKSGKLILITDSKVIKENMKVNQDSLFDSRFNIPVETDNKIIEYACDCEKLIGRYNEGEICPNCDTIVEIKYSIELLRRGWIDLDDYKIIVPATYKKVRNYLSKKRLEEMIHYDPASPDVLKPDPNNPFKAIGLVEFERRYVEILNYFKPISKKPELFDILLQRKDITFSSKIYVMSSAHRPAFLSAKGKTLQYHHINSLFVTILADLNLVKIHDLAIEKIKGKEKIIRSNIISGRLWYSSRMVIIAETEIDDIDSVRMSYKGFLGMFELEIINAMLRGYGNTDFAKMTTAECRIYLTRCKFSTEVDEYIFDIIQKLVHNRKDDGVWVVVDRNPSFDLGSLQCCKVADVFKDAKNNILTIPHNSLKEFNGDFDGDVLNVYSPKERCVVDAFKEGFRPSKLILDRTGGYFNHKMTPIKDEYAFIKSFCDKSYKPIDTNNVDLRKLEDIIKGIDKPFDLNLIKALRDLDIMRKELANSEYFMRNEVSHDTLLGKVDGDYIRTDEVYDPISDDKVSCLSLLSENEFVPV